MCSRFPLFFIYLTFKLVQFSNMLSNFVHVRSDFVFPKKETFLSHYSFFFILSQQKQSVSVSQFCKLSGFNSREKMIESDSMETILCVLPKAIKLSAKSSFGTNEHKNFFYTTHTAVEWERGKMFSLKSDFVSKHLRQHQKKVSLMCSVWYHLRKRIISSQVFFFSFKIRMLCDIKCMSVGVMSVILLLLMRINLISLKWTDQQKALTNCMKFSKKSIFTFSHAIFHSRHVFSYDNISKLSLNHCKSLLHSTRACEDE